MGVTWTGLAEFKTALRNLPEDLAGEAQTIVLAAASEAEREIVAGYPEGPTGNLRSRVSTETEGSQFGARAIVRSRAPHAHLFERGTRLRRTGRGKSRGTMPPAAASAQMIPKAIRARERMVRALIALVERAGLRVERS